MSLRCIPVIPVAEIQILVVLSSNENKLTFRFACESTATLSPHSVYIRVYQVYLYLDQELNESKSYICLREKWCAIWNMIKSYLNHLARISAIGFHISWPGRQNGLTFRHHTSYIYIYIYIGQTYRSSPEWTFYIFSQQIYYLIIFFRLSLTIFVYSSTKCRVFPNVTLLGS